MFWKRNKYQIFEKVIFDIPGIITKYALNSNNFIFAIYRNKEINKYYEHTICGISIDKGIVWKSEIELSFPNELRIDKTGLAWIAFDNQMIQIDENGTIRNEIKFNLHKKQQIGSFVALENGFILTIQANEQSRPNAKVIKTDLLGQILWETEIQPEYMSHSGVVEMKASNNWEVEKKRAWYPKNWLCLYDNAIVFSSNNILVSYFEMPRSGIGISYCLDANSGKIKWTTKPTPFDSIACFDDGSFIIGKYGYGAFDTDLYNSQGHIIDHWGKIGKYSIDKNKNVFLIEIENSSKSKTKVYKLEKNGVAIEGDTIEDYYMSDPLIDEHGNIVFWRNESIQIIDKNLKKYNLITEKKTEKSYSLPERILMIGKGLLIFSFEDKLFKVQTNLGELAQSSWPCKYSNMERNPVINEFTTEYVKGK